MFDIRKFHRVKTKHVTIYDK